MKEIGRRDFLVRSAKIAGAVVVAAAGGLLYGGERKRRELILPGDLSHELEAMLETAGYTFIYRPAGGTVETIRNVGLEISSSPWQEGQPDFERVASEHPWIAINPDNPYLPSEENLDFRGLATLVRRQSADVQRRLGSEVEVVLGEVIDWVGLNLAYQIATGQELIVPEGFIMTGTTFGGKGVGIGRSALGEPLGYSVFDSPPPRGSIPSDKFFAAGLVVPKLS